MTMNNARLLHASARGARIEEPYGPDAWIAARTLPNPKYPDVTYFNKRRIHPEDGHLAYGPISSALRDFAKRGRWDSTVTALMAECLFKYELPYPFVLGAEWVHAQTFALFLAEVMADRGL
jgi:hypothetical protein